MNIKVCVYVHGESYGGVERLVDWLYNNLNESYRISVITPSKPSSCVLKMKNIYFLKSENKNDIYNIILKIDPDIIYVPRSSCSTHLNFIEAIYKTKKNIKYISGIHIPVKIFELDANPKLLTNIIYTASDCIHILTDLDIGSIPLYMKSKIHIIPNPITNYINHKIPKNSNYRIISVGRLTFEKNFEDLIKSIYYIKKKIKDIELHIYGEGPYRNKLDRLINILSLNQHVYIHSYTEKWLEQIKENDIYVCSSYYEGYGMALAEAISAGLNVIFFSSCGGPKSFIQNNKNGIEIEGIPDPIKLADMVILLCENKSLMKKISRNAKNTFNYEHNDLILNEWCNMLQPLYTSSNILSSLKSIDVDDELLSMVPRVKGLLLNGISNFVKRS